MDFTFVFLLNSILLGVGLAMDAFSVSIANALNEPFMSRARASAIAGTYAIFQFAMPLIGWFFVHAAAERFSDFQKFIPWIAFALLCVIGGKMLAEGVESMRSAGDHDQDARNAGTAVNGAARLTFRLLILQGIATSIDALSVGFTISGYGPAAAFVCALIIAAVTFFICVGGLAIGRTAGRKLGCKAQFLGGAILIGIGFEILISSMF